MINMPAATPLTITSDADVELLRSVPARYAQLAAELGKRIIGQDEIIRDLFVALAVQGHVLMIGVPGLAKTLLVRSLAEILDRAEGVLCAVNEERGRAEVGEVAGALLLRLAGRVQRVGEQQQAVGGAGAL